MVYAIHAGDGAREGTVCAELCEEGYTVIVQKCVCMCVCVGKGTSTLTHYHFWLSLTGLSTPLTLSVNSLCKVPGLNTTEKWNDLSFVSTHTRTARGGDCLVDNRFIIIGYKYNRFRGLLGS